MSDGEPGRMTDPPSAVRLEVCFLAGAAHALLELLNHIAVEVRDVQDEHGCGLDLVSVGRWLLGSMMVVACLSRTTAEVAYGKSVNVVLCMGESGAGPIRSFRSSIRASLVILQSTHEAALDVVDLKRQALELS